MIANITLGKKAASMILYNENKVRGGVAVKIDSSSDVMAHEDGAIGLLDSLSELTKTENTNVQISLSLAHGENVSDETFVKISRDYLELIGFSNSPFVVYRHNDTEHHHVHICTSIIQNDDTKVNMFNNYWTSQKATRELELKYNLKLVSSFKSKKEVSSIKGLKEYNQILSEINLDLASKKDVRKIVAKATTLVLEQYKPTSFTETKKLYGQLGIVINEVFNDDKTHKGYVFNLKDRSQTPVIKASSLYMKLNNTTLEKAYIKNTNKKSKSNSKRIGRTLYMILKDYETLNRTDFDMLLKQRNIIPLYDTYQDGRVYGMSYFDEKSGFIYKASDVDKQYSYNRIKDKVNDVIDTKPSLNKLLEDNFYVLFEEMRGFGNKTSALNFAKQEDTSSNLKVAIFNSGVEPAKIDSIVDDFLNNKIEKLEKKSTFSEEKGLLFRALNDYFNANLDSFLKDNPDLSEADYINNQLVFEEKDYLDYVGSTLQLTVLSKDVIAETIDVFIDGKINENLIKPLKDYIKTSIKEQFKELVGDRNNIDVIHYINDNRDHISSKIYDTISSSIKNDESFSSFHEELIKSTYDNMSQAFLSAELINNKNDIIKNTVSSLVAGNLDQKIELYNYYLLDKDNFKKIINSNLSPEQIELFKPKELSDYLSRYVDKVEDVILPFLDLNKLILEDSEHRTQFVSYANLTDGNGPKISRLYFKYDSEKYSDFIKLFGADTKKLQDFVENKVENLTLNKVVNEEITSIITELKMNFETQYELHHTGHLNIDFYNYLLLNKEAINKYVLNKLKDLNDIPVDKIDLLTEIASNDSGILPKFFNKIEEYNLPLTTANIIAKNTINNYIASWKGSLSRQEIAERLKSTEFRNEIYQVIYKNINENNIADKINNNKDLIAKVDERIESVLYSNSEFYSQDLPANHLSEAEGVMNFINQMVQNAPAREGLNTAKNDKRKRRTPD